MQKNSLNLTDHLTDQAPLFTAGIEPKKNNFTSINEAIFRKLPDFFRKKQKYT